MVTIQVMFRKQISGGACAEVSVSNTSLKIIPLSNQFWNKPLYIPKLSYLQHLTTLASLHHPDTSPLSITFLGGVFWGRARYFARIPTPLCFLIRGITRVGVSPRAQSPPPGQHAKYALYLNECKCELVK